MGFPGLPRIASTEEDIKELLEAVGQSCKWVVFVHRVAEPEKTSKDLAQMIDNYGSRILCTHLRSTQRNPDGSFYEANHREGSVDMYKVVRALILEMQKRKTVVVQTAKYHFALTMGTPCWTICKSKPQRTLATVRLGVYVALKKYGVYSLVSIVACKSHRQAKDKANTQLINYTGSLWSTLYEKFL